MLPTFITALFVFSAEMGISSLVNSKKSSHDRSVEGEPTSMGVIRPTNITTEVKLKSKDEVPTEWYEYT